jgi:predicted ATPase
VALITEFSVTGLVGREDTYRQKLNRHVNIFFGLNGSGKTSLLKIFHSALTDDASLLRGVVFERAEIKIQLHGQSAVLTKAISRSRREQADLFPPYSDEFRKQGITEAQYRAFRQRELGEMRLRWATKPETQQAKKFSHRYLPTTRLYVEPEEAKRNARFMVAADTGGEDQIEERFAALIESRWTRYSSTMLKAVGEAQAEGLANIFQAVFSDKSERAHASPIEIRKAYQRLTAFLRRQGSVQVLGTFDSFERRYQDNLQLRRVVEDINGVEERIEHATAQRDTLQRLIESMFTGRKQVTFGDTAIHISSDLRAPITLASLSTGEKHLLRILVEVLLAEDNLIIIDEPELSMHVDWQKQLVAAMRQVNPSAQLMLATHSPEIMADSHDSEIFRI